ncbi:binding protein [Wolffia australiana]
MGKKKKVILPPNLPPEVREEEIEVSDEDLQFVRGNKAFASFLTRLDTKSIDKHVTRVADVKEDELEKLYEQRSKKQSLQRSSENKFIEVDPVDALPVKTLDGQLYYRAAEKKPEKVDEHEDDKNTDAAAEVDDKGFVKLTKAERRGKLKKLKKEAKRQAKEEGADEAPTDLRSKVLATVEEDLSAEELFQQKKSKLAEIGLSLLEDPESNIKNLKDFLQFCHDRDHRVVKLGLLSLLAIFKDIIPGYRIRLPTEKEMEMKVSKTIRKLRFYESTLLTTYKQYLLRLVSLEKQPSFTLVAIRCMCNLLDAVPHFNFSGNLLTVIVKNMSSSDDMIRKLCCDSMKTLFGNEGKHGGQPTLDAVQQISFLVKDNDCQLHPDCAEVFLSLVLDDDLGRPDTKEEDKGKPKKKGQRRKEEREKELPGRGKKARKQELIEKTREEVNADLQSASFVPSPEERRNIQSQTLAAVFETYFRVLKHTINSSIPRANADSSSADSFDSHPLLAPCLKGLGKFSHLIDLDFMADIMGCLKKLAGLKSLSVSERLQCCIVAFKIMKNNLDALNIDLQEFYCHLYNLLLEYRPGRDQGDTLALAFSIMLSEGKQHDMQRAAAFIKRLATFSLCYGPQEAMPALVTVRHLLLRNPKCRNLLENDPGGGSLSGLVLKYDPETSDPNLSGALSSVLWELSLLAKHYHPSLSSTSSWISNMASTLTQTHLPTTSPQQAFAELSLSRLPLPAPKPPSSLNRKRKRERGTSSLSLSSPLLGEDAMMEKLEGHFSLLEEISEAEKLQSELNRLSNSISLYAEFKKQAKSLKTGKKKMKKTK